ncbi:MAG: ATP synthase F1 subunit gamma [Chitinophagales bacterium]|jgi:F-type H+-transporting ATPase subunit gamma|nr:ATP synthase F1 subunit gamma [Chitinophagales bacterium]
MPGQLKEVRSRIAAVKSTQQITKAMKLVAASKFRRAQDRIIQMRPYSAKLYDMLRNIMSGASDVNIAYGNTRETNHILIIIITSDRGLCGGFNSNVAKLLRNQLENKYKNQYAAGKVTALCIGKKGFEAARKYKNLQLITDYQDLFADLTFEKSMEVSEKVMQDFLDKKYDVVEVLYNFFKNQATQIPTVEQFLPIEKLVAETDGKTSATDFIFQPDQSGIIEELVPKIIKTRFFRFLLDSNASEHSARMMAMENATNNAEELLRDLNIKYNRARQAAITTELTEIVSGAAALQG